jgi:hypothetical protein
MKNLICGELTPTAGPQGPHYRKGVFAMRIGRGPANKSCSSGWVCHVKFNLWGAHPNSRPAGSTPSNGGICNEKSVGASKQKLLLGVGLLGKILFVEAHPNPRPAGSTPQNGGVCNENRVGASKQKLLLRVGLPGKFNL